MSETETFEITEIREAAKDFFRENDRFPEFVFVGIEVFDAVKEYFFAEKMFLNHVTVNTVVGERLGVEATALGVKHILPSAHLDDYAVGPMEGLFS